jgi:hypothetical protein
MASRPASRRAATVAAAMDPTEQARKVPPDPARRPPTPPHPPRSTARERRMCSIDRANGGKIRFSPRNHIERSEHGGRGAGGRDASLSQSLEAVVSGGAHEMLAADDDRAYVGRGARDARSGVNRSPRERQSRVARRAPRGNEVPNPRRASRKRRRKGDAGTFRPASLRSATRRKRPRSRRRSRVRRLRLIPRTSRQPRVVQEVRVGVASQNRQSCSHAEFGPLEWRDSDSNRGHHGFQGMTMQRGLLSGLGRRVG